MPPKDDVARYRENRQDEINSAALYRTLAALEPQTQLSQIYERLATVEERHARFWERHLRAAGDQYRRHSPAGGHVCLSGWPGAWGRSGCCRPSPRPSAWVVTCTIGSLKRRTPRFPSMSAPTHASSAPSSARRPRWERTCPL